MLTNVRGLSQSELRDELTRARAVQNWTSLKALDQSVTARDWPHGDNDELDKRFDRFVESIKSLPEGKSVHEGIDTTGLISNLAKPSGRLLNCLHLRWHFPTFSTSFSFLGATADISNPCLEMAFKKLGLESGNEVLMSELFYGRTQSMIIFDSFEHVLN
jgi:hypothetical protein